MSLTAISEVTHEMIPATLINVYKHVEEVEKFEGGHVIVETITSFLNVKFLMYKKNKISCGRLGYIWPVLLHRACNKTKSLYFFSASIMLPPRNPPISVLPQHLPASFVDLYDHVFCGSSVHALGTLSVHYGVCV